MVPSITPVANAPIQGVVFPCELPQIVIGVLCDISHQIGDLGDVATAIIGVCVCSLKKNTLCSIIHLRGALADLPRGGKVSLSFPPTGNNFSCICQNNAIASSHNIFRARHYIYQPCLGVFVSINFILRLP